jgi:hypothetical protein
MLDYKVSEETATSALNGFFECYEVDPKEEAISDDQRIAIDAAIAKVTKAIRLGKVTIEGMIITQTLSKAPSEVTTVVYGEMTAKAKVEMGKKSQDDHYGRIYCLLGSLSGLGERAIMGLKGSDLSTAESIGIIFLLL